MPQIPVLSGSEQPVTSAAIGAAPRSLAGEQAVLEGQSALARGLGDVGGTVGNAALFLARIKNRADELRVEQAIRTDEIDFDAWRESEPDETKWAPEAQQRVQAVKTSMESLKLAPVVRREAEARLNGWAEDRSIRVRTEADKYASKRHDAVLVQQIQVAAEQGDKETIDSTMEERVILGLVHRDVAEAAKRDAYEKADAAQVTRAIQEDPRYAIERLEAQTEGGKWRNYKDLSETSRITLLRSAKNAQETMRAEHAQEISTNILAGKVAGLDARLDYEVKTGGLTAETAANLRAFARGQRSPMDQASAASQLWQAAIDLQPSDPDYTQKVMQLRSQLHGLDPAVKEPILDTLNQKDRNTVTEDTQRVYDALNRDFRANTFGNVQTYTQAEIDNDKKLRKQGLKEGDPKDRKRYEEASATLFRYQRAMRQFLLTNPKATTEQIQVYRAQLTATDTQAQLGQLALDALTGSALK